MIVRVKICGLTNADDALAAVEAGADALGFMFFAGSKRNLSFADAAEIIRELPAFVAKVGVFVNAPADEIRRAETRPGSTRCNCTARRRRNFARSSRR